MNTRLTEKGAWDFIQSKTQSDFKPDQSFYLEILQVNWNQMKDYNNQQTQWVGEAAE